MIGRVNEKGSGRRSWSPPRWVAPLFAVCAAVLVVWVGLLAFALPTAHRVTHWAVAWVGFDAAALVAMLIVLAACVWRRSGWVEPVATAAATLLLVDAWFDVTTASSAGGLARPLGAAIVIDVPLGLVCLALARRAALRRRDTEVGG